MAAGQSGPRGDGCGGDLMRGNPIEGARLTMLCSCLEIREVVAADKGSRKQTPHQKVRIHLTATSPFRR